VTNHQLALIQQGIDMSNSRIAKLTWELAELIRQDARQALRDQHQDMIDAEQAKRNWLVRQIES